jgi:hypothetical protein
VWTREVRHTTRLANATFEEAASQLEELGYSHEIIADGVLFSREPVVEEHGPSARIAAAAFLGLGGSVELGSLDQVMDVLAYRGFNRCPVLVCSKSKEKGKKNTYYKLCANPSKFHSMGQHFCGVHAFTLTKHPGALCYQTTLPNSTTRQIQLKSRDCSARGSGSLDSR